MSRESAADYVRGERLRQLREQVARLERRRPAKLHPQRSGPDGSAGTTLAAIDAEDAVVSTGCGVLDRLLARHGLERGSLVEWLSPGRGAAAAGLAWLAACQAARQGGHIVVIDRQRRFYPPAALAWGVDPSLLAVVRVEDDENELWAVAQALGSPAVAAVWLYRDELSPLDFRRWQLAAERGGALGLLVRPARVQGQPTWADVRWKVQPASGAAGSRPAGNGRARSWQLQVELVRCRGGAAGQCVAVELDDVSGALRATAPRSMELQLREPPTVPASHAAGATWYGTRSS